MEFTQQGDLFTAADDEAVALVREIHGLLNECAVALGLPTRMSATSTTFGPGTLQFYVSVLTAAGQGESFMPPAVVEFIEAAREGDIKRSLARVLASSGKSAQPGWFSRNWKYLLGGAAGLGVVILLARSRKRA